MYPFLRLTRQFLKYRNKPLGFGDTHVSTMRCWPWDLDPWMELNNGRTLTLYDLGRLPLFHRTGILKIAKNRGWGFTVAGSSVRYRRRIVSLEKITMRTRAVGWDDRFFYVEQSIWNQKGECANQVLIRAALLSKGGMLPPRHLVEAIGWQGDPPVLPEWVQNWVEADATRPWPPEI